MVHTIKGLRVVYETEVEDALVLPGGFHQSAHIGNMVASPSCFPEPSLDIWNLTFHYRLKAPLYDLKRYLARVADECNHPVV